MFSRTGSQKKGNQFTWVYLSHYNLGKDQKGECQSKAGIIAFQVLVFMKELSRIIVKSTTISTFRNKPVGRQLWHVFYGLFILNDYYYFNIWEKQHVKFHTELPVANIWIEEWIYKTRRHIVLNKNWNMLKDTYREVPSIERKTTVLPWKEAQLSCKDEKVPFIERNTTVLADMARANPKSQSWE